VYILFTHRICGFYICTYKNQVLVLYLQLKLQLIILGWSEPALMNTIMGWWSLDRTLFFIVFLFSQCNESGFLKLRFIQLDGLKRGKQGWFLHGCLHCASHYFQQVIILISLNWNHNRGMKYKTFVRLKKKLGTNEKNSFVHFDSGYLCIN